MYLQPQKTSFRHEIFLDFHLTKKQLGENQEL